MQRGRWIVDGWTVVAEVRYPVCPVYGDGRYAVARGAEAGAGYALGTFCFLDLVFWRFIYIF